MFCIVISRTTFPSRTMLYARIFSGGISPVPAASRSFSCIFASTLSTRKDMNGGVSTLKSLSSAKTTRIESLSICRFAKRSPVVVFKGTLLFCSVAGGVTGSEAAGVGFTISALLKPLSNSVESTNSSRTRIPSSSVSISRMRFSSNDLNSATFFTFSPSVFSPLIFLSLLIHVC